MSSINKLVYIVILNWNGKNDTIECVKSCMNINYLNYVLIIADNNSIDGSYDIIKNNFPDIKIIQNADNFGFAGGNNVGIKYALNKGADYIWLLNNDTVVSPDALTELVSLMEKHSNAGIVGSKIYYYDEPENIWFAGGNINYRTGSCTHIGFNENDTGKYDKEIEVDYICGCSLMISKNAINKVGLMDERYFIYFEETDWCERIRKAGFKIIYSPKSKIWHKISKCFGDQSTTFIYYMFRNSLLFTIKNNKRYFYNVLWHKSKEIYSLYKNNKRDKARFALKGMIDFFLMRFGRLRSQ